MYAAQTKHTLENLGITRKYKGFYYLSDAVEIVNLNETTLLNVGKQIYSPISLKYSCNSRTIERNIRTVILNAWKNNKYQIENIMGVKLTSPPTVTEFIDGLAYYVKTRNNIYENIIQM